ncbi:MAG: 50S ribosomal protein L23 [Candidatus Bathyarchaeota archaeon]|nr:50S ribosomal protein L23 [Candidatus Bathyarchaeota archaeon]
MDPQKVILYPIMTEVTSRLIETENKLVFITNIKAKKKDVKRAVEELYEVKVRDVNVAITRKGEKKAFVRLKPEYSATDVAIKLGIL